MGRELALVSILCRRKILLLRIHIHKLWGLIDLIHFVLSSTSGGGALSGLSLRGANRWGAVAEAGAADILEVTEFFAVVANRIAGGRGALCRTWRAVGVLAGGAMFVAAASVSFVFEGTELKVEGVDLSVDVLVIVGWGGGCGTRWCRVDLDGHGVDGDAFGVGSKAFELYGLLECFVECSRVRFEELIADCRLEVGHKKVECHVVEGGGGSVSDEVLCGSGTVGYGNGDEFVNFGEGCRPWGGRYGEGPERDEGIEVVDCFDDSGVITNDRFVLALAEVG